MINDIPVLDLDGRAGLVGLSMYARGTITQPPGTTTYWTEAAHGGCVPVAAAEIVPVEPRTVRWTYLIHAQGDNLPLSVDNNIADPNNVYVVVLAESDNHKSEFSITTGLRPHLEALDPRNRIPNANAVVIWAWYGSLGITPGAHVGVLRGNRAPLAPVGGGGGGGDGCCKCFITNAVCATLGKPDDCFELTTLRFYRDEVLRRTASGRDAIADYEDIAPGIVRAIAMRPNARQIHHRLYHSFIRPAVDAASASEFDRAFTIYRDMVERQRRP